MKLPAIALLLAMVVVPAMAADLKEEVVAAEKRMWQAFADHDVKTYDNGWTADAVEALADGSVLMGKQKILADLKSANCKVKSFDGGWESVSFVGFEPGGSCGNGCSSPPNLTVPTKDATT